MIDEEINLDIINIETNVSSGPNVESSITTGMNITGVGIGGPRGEKGDRGDAGDTATIAVGTTTTLSAGSSATVSNSGTSSAAVFNFGIPKGDKGDTGASGAAATITAGTTTTLSAGSSATVTNSGTSSAAVFDFGIPQGAKGDTGAAGSAATITVGTTTTLPAGSSATVTNSGTSSAAVFNFGIPKGDKGDTGDVSDVQIAGTSVVNAGVANIDYAGLNTGGVVKVNASYGINTANTGTLIGVTKDYSSYDSGSDLTIIDKGTLENVIEGKGLVSNTDYASFSKPGLIKPSSGVGTDIVSSTGVFYASTLDYATYNSANNGTFVGKGTLENVITGKGLVDQTALAGKQDTLTAGTGIDITNNVISATGGGDNKYYFGTCATAAATRAKVVECEGFKLEEGATISVYFTYAQTYNGYPYLNVNDTGNIAVVYKGGSAGIRYMWSAGEIIDFTYHNEYWVCHGRALASTTYYGITKLSNSAISTSTSLALTPAVVNALAENMITGYDAYSASATYAVGDRVRYSSYAYECNTAITTPEAWTAAHWTALDPLQTQIDALEGSIPTVNNATITVTNNGKTVGTFTTNASSAVTIALKTQHTSWGAYHEL